ncbi:MAG: head GIN domain-containing protein [Bacteroidia bacterium]
MKHNIIIITLITLIILLSSSCGKNSHWIKGDGPNVTNERTVGEFESLSLSMSADVEVFYDSFSRIELNGQQNILNVIETYSSGKTLQIKLKRHYKIRKHNPIRIRVYTPRMESVDLSGSGNVSFINSFDNTTFKANISGSGDINYKGSISNYINANISGSGGININSSSQCNAANYTISGSGNLNAEWLKVESVDAKISGSGNQKLYAVNSLNAKISGSGDIRYHGNPTINSNISGSGRIIALD